MSTTFLSPKIVIKEVDVSHYPTTGDGVIPVFIGTAKKGPIGEPTWVSNSQEFINIFGEPIDESTLAQTYLSYTEKSGRGNAWIMRVAIPYKKGMVEDLAAIAVDEDKERGWGRLAVFKGISKGKLCFREISTEAPLVFHEAGVDNITFNGNADGDLTFSVESYDGVSDNSFTLQIISEPTHPTLSNIHGATYVITDIDGNIISTGTIDDSDYDNISTDVVIMGMTFTISATTMPLEENDFFTWTATPDNRYFRFSVDNGATVEYNFTDGVSFTTAESFIAALNIIITAAAPYIGIISDSYACIQTDNYGEMIQFIGSEAFGIETGMDIYSIDVPKAYFMNTEPGPFIISSSNNEFVLTVIDTETDYKFEITLPISSSMTIATLVSALNSRSYYNGRKLFDAYSILFRETDGTNGYRLLITTNSNTEYAQLRTEYSNFVDEVGINYPYFAYYSAFHDSRNVLPDQSSINPGYPASCDAGASAQCTVDSDYYQNIVGFVVAKYAGTWTDKLTVSVEPEMVQGTGDLFTITVKENGAEVDAIRNVSFDANSSNYVADKLNPGTSGGGIRGNDWINWEERPSILDNDPEISTYDYRMPGRIYNRGLEGGQNGIPPSAAYSSELDKVIIGNEAQNIGIYKFSNTELYHYHTLAIPGNTSGSVVAATIQMLQNRGSGLFLVDPPFGFRPKDIVDWHNGVLSGSTVLSTLNSSYGALYWSWIRWYNQFTGEYVYIPPSGYVSGTISYSESENEIWYAPAGPNRGMLNTAVDLEYNPNEPEMDLLYGYNNAVNPIVKVYKQGIVINGQRTLQRANTALDRVNVRLLINELKFRSKPILRNFHFEFNDEYTRNRIESLFRTMMDGVQAGRGVRAYRVICDKTNNTDVRIGRSELWVALLIKPTPVSEFIQLNIGIMSQTQTFAMEEILAAVGIVF